MGNFKKRWKSESPDFFKKIVKVGLTVGGIGATILALPLTAPIVLPAVVTTIAGYMVAGGAIASAVAKTTVKDTKDLE